MGGAMGDAVWGGSQATGRPVEHRLGLLSIPLAFAVFIVDTFTDIESAIAVLYVLVLLLAATMLSRRGILRVAAGCALLAVLSFFLSHWQDMDLSAVLRCGVSLAAILITGALLVRDHDSRALLLRANAALARSEKRYRCMFEQARISLWEQDFTAVKAALDALRASGVTDLAAHAQSDPGWARDIGALIVTTNVNDATVEMLGAVGRPAVLGSLDRFLPAGDPAMLQVLLALWEGRDRFEGRAQLITADGRTLTVLLGISFPDDGVGFDQVVVGVVDITQRERTQEALLAAQAELARAARAATLGALSASIAHELNQPLGAIVLNAQACLRWLRRDQPDIGTAAKAADRIVRDGQRAAEIIQRTRGMLVKDTRCDETIDLRQLVDEVALLLERELSAAGAVLVTGFAPDAPPVRGSRVGLQQVLINLVTNGLHAMVEMGVEAGVEAGSRRRELSVTVDRLGDSLESGQESGSQVTVAVRDRGPGIDETSSARLFDPFFTTRPDGMGMGLAICRSTIESCGGTLTARNHPDGGAVFEFTIPAALPPSPQPPFIEPPAFPLAAARED
ncbi:signal transduction histidine kinase [Azospirillum lipoferum]|uniref:histidine kinase n=1 Tax=Azospirillum lipoferum TaxID=193 RepID=A0A5A9GLL0_AZOLI|nr:MULTISPECIES: ATP-binding protein [Azospirillum]KAA0595348.1 sensor histidine kinase [Azospirillum lipoferum]MCP1611760.1 signal transduction histidine kinase [Azospirillum lipoferum]MDW5533482.1 ATP-binding protein [Azospirillum sp. NL1]